MKINIFELDENEEQLILIYESVDRNENLVNLLLYKNHYVLIVLSFLIIINIDYIDVCNAMINVIIH